MISTPFTWQFEDWHRLSDQLNILFAPDVIEHLNRLLVDIFQTETGDPGALDYIQTLLSRYVAHGRPLNGYFLVCCVIEAQWTILAQALCPPDIPCKSGRKETVGAAAANKAWSILSRRAASQSGITDSRIQSALKSTLDLAMQSFTDLLVQIEETEAEPSIDTYAWETMSESLVGKARFLFSTRVPMTFCRNLDRSAQSSFTTWTTTCFLGSRSS